MNFTSKGVQVTEEKGVSSFLGFGIKELKINRFELKESKKGSTKVIIHMETRPIDTAKYPKFTKAEDSTNGGQVGRVENSKYWMKDDEHYQQFIKDMCMLADKLGVREELDKIDTGDDFPGYVNALNNVLTGKFKWFKITAEEYAREGKKPGTNLHLGRYSKATPAISDVPEKLKFDMNDAYDYKKLEQADQTALDKPKIVSDPF